MCVHLNVGPGKMSKITKSDQPGEFSMFLKVFGDQPNASKAFAIVFIVVFLPCAVVGFSAAWVKTKMRPRVPLWVSDVVVFAITGTLAGTPFVYFEYLPFERTSAIVSFAVSLLVSYMFARAFLTVLSSIDDCSEIERH